MKALNLIGQRFGKLIGFWRIPPVKINGKWLPTRWLCQCDCSKIVSVNQHTLTKSIHASCPACRGVCWQRAEKSEDRVVRQIVAVLTRIDWIKERLLAGRPFNADDISVAHNVCQKTAYRDIDVIRSYYGWQIGFDMRERSYFLDGDPDAVD